MGNLLLITVTLLYSGVAIDYILKGQYGMSLVFFAYAVANVGFILVNRGV